MPTWRGGAHFVEESLEHAWGEFFAPQAVTCRRDEHFPSSTFVERRDDVEVERIADGTGLLGAIEHAHPGCRRRQQAGQLSSGEWTVQADLEQADLLAVPVHLLDGFLGGADSRSHQDDDAFGVGSTL